MLRTGNFTHDGFDQRIKAACPRSGRMAENLAGNPSAKGAVDSWMSSTTGHCEAIMNPNYRFVGVGTAKGGPYGAYWTMKFAADC